MRPIVKYTVEVLCGHLSAKTAESIMMPFGLIIIIINDNVYGAVLMTMLLLDSAVATGRELNSQPASCKSNALATRLPSLGCGPRWPQGIMC